MSVYGVFMNYGQIEFVFSSRELAQQWIDSQKDHDEYHIGEFRVDDTSDDSHFGIKT